MNQSRPNPAWRSSWTNPTRESSKRREKATSRRTRHSFVVIKATSGDLRLLRDRGLADDATQEAFVRTFRHIRRFRGRSKFSTWLFSVARNAAIDELRKVQRRDRIEEKLHRQPHGAQEPGAVSEVRDAIARLPTDLREVVVMVDLLGFSYRDAGVACGIPEGTVKSRVHRARRELAGLLMHVEEWDADEI